MFLTSSLALSAPLGDVTYVIFLHRIAESVSPPTLIHLERRNLQARPPCACPSAGSSKQGLQLHAPPQTPLSKASNCLHQCRHLQARPPCTSEVPPSKATKCLHKCTHLQARPPSVCTRVDFRAPNVFSFTNHNPLCYVKDNVASWIFSKTIQNKIYIFISISGNSSDFLNIMFWKMRCRTKNI